MIENLSRSFMTILSTSSTTTGRLVFVLKHHSQLMIRFGDFTKEFLRIKWQWLNNAHNLISLWLHHCLCPFPFPNVYRINGNKFTITITMLENNAIIISCSSQQKKLIIDEWKSLIFALLSSSILRNLIVKWSRICFHQLKRIERKLCI